ncbi:MAG: glycosyltransferase family 4 protein [Candidatus Saccharimonadales bacterium]
MKKDQILKVGLVFDDSLDSNDGVAQQVKTIGKWLTDQGHHVSYLVGQTKMKRWEGSPVYSLAKNQKVSFNANRLSVPLPVGKRRLRELVELREFDVLHVQMPHSPFLAQKIVNMADTKTAVVGTFHIYPASRLVSVGASFLKLTYGKGLKRFDEIISVSPAAASFAQKAFGIRSIILPNVIDIGRFKIKIKNIQKKKAPSVVFLGRLVERKGCRLLIEAFAILHKDCPDARLTILGDGPQRKDLEKLTIKKGIAEVVEFKGFIDEADKPSYLAAADIACFPSIGGESFGIVLIEAMAAGAGVVVGGDNPGYRSVLGDRMELLVDPKDPQLFAKRLKKLLENIQLARELHEWQKDQVRRYDVSVVGPKIISLYERAIAKRNKKVHNLN